MCYVFIMKTLLCTNDANFRRNIGILIDSLLRAIYKRRDQLVGVRLQICKFVSVDSLWIADKTEHLAWNIVERMFHNNKNKRKLLCYELARYAIGIKHNYVEDIL